MDSPYVYPVYMANNKAASHFQEDFMANLWSSSQFLEQIVLWTLRWASSPRQSESQRHTDWLEERTIRRSRNPQEIP